MKVAAGVSNTPNMSTENASRGVWDRLIHVGTSTTAARAPPRPKASGGRHRWPHAEPRSPERHACTAEVIPRAAAYSAGIIQMSACHSRWPEITISATPAAVATTVPRVRLRHMRWTSSGPSGRAIIIDVTTSRCTQPRLKLPSIQAVPAITPASADRLNSRHSR